MRSGRPEPGGDELARAFARNGPLAPGAAPPLFVRAVRGSELTLTDGTVLLDCATGGLLPLGHNPSPALETRGLSDLSVAGEGVEFPVRVELMQKLAEVVPGGTNRRVRLCDSGREALAQALRLARLHGPGPGAGWLAASADPEPGFPPGTGCLVVHPFDGRAGYAARLCRDRGWLLVSDETGIAPGMSGRMLASELLDARPDIIVLGRGLAVGLPYGAVVAGSSELRWPDSGNGGSLAGSAVALGWLTRLEAGWLDVIRELAGRLRRGLEELAARHGGAVAGAGLVLTLRLGQPGAAGFVARCRQAGLLVRQCGESAAAVEPSSAITPGQLDRLFSAVDGAWKGKGR